MLDMVQKALASTIRAGQVRTLGGAVFIKNCVARALQLWAAPRGPWTTTRWFEVKWSACAVWHTAEKGPLIEAQPLGQMSPINHLPVTRMVPRCGVFQ